jgi:hypothetical protein
MDTKIMTVTKQKHYCSYVPKVRLSGLWLNEFGFNNDKLVSISYSAGNIIIKLEGDGTPEIYLKAAKEVFKNNSGTLLQIARETIKRGFAPRIKIAGMRLNQIGFTIGSIIAVHCEYGLIRLRLLDPEKIQKDFP